MYSVVVLSLAASAAATANLMALPQVKRDILAPRQTGTPTLDGISGECATAALGLVADLPTPPAEILSDAVENPQTDPCSFSTPASLSAQYSSYSSELLEWVSEKEGELSSALEACPELSSYASMVPVCSTASGVPGLIGNNATATPTGDNSPSETSSGASGTPDPDSGAARQGGMAFVALAVAGVVAAAL